MTGKTITIRASAGGTFDCYLVVPEGRAKAPAVVLASAIHGVDRDIRAIADEVAAKGFIAAAPDLFWRSVPGPLERDDPRVAPRGQPRLEKIKTGEADMADTLAEVKRLPRSNGRAMAMGFCYGGPYAILGPARLGYDAGVGCHATQMKDYMAELEGTTKPVCLLWGDRDHAAPAELLDACRALAARKKTLELHIFPGLLHGYMMRENDKAFEAVTRDFSMTRALAILDSLRSAT